MEELARCAQAIKTALVRNGITGKNGDEIDHIELFGAAEAADADSRNFVLCPGNAYDRSPCGTGTSAKMACLYEDGHLAPGRVWRQEGILGTCFDGSVSVKDGQRDSVDYRRGLHYGGSEIALCGEGSVPLGDRLNALESAYDVVVVGAGIVGAACAHYLMEEGLRVAVLERGSVGSAATGAAMGHLVAMDDSPAQLALTKFSLQLWKDLENQLPATAEYRQPGTLWIASDDEEMAEVRRKYEVYRSAGLACEVLDSVALSEAEPRLRQPLAGALRVLGDGVIDPQAAAEFLLRDVAERGALFTDCNVVSIESGSILLGDGTRVSAGYVVNAAGCAAVELTPGISIRKRKGHLMITDRYPGFLRHQVVELGYLKSAHSVTG